MKQQGFYFVLVLFLEKKLRKLFTEKTKRVHYAIKLPTNCTFQPDIPLISMQHKMEDYMEDYKAIMSHYKSFKRKAFNEGLISSKSKTFKMREKLEKSHDSFENKLAEGVSEETNQNKVIENGNKITENWLTKLAKRYRTRGDKDANIQLLKTFIKFWMFRTLEKKKLIQLWINLTYHEMRLSLIVPLL